MNGIELGARFSYITNSLRFCGPKEASKQFLQYIEKKDNEIELKNSLKKFEGVYPYISSISEKTGKDIFDYDVVEAYWIGNNLLDNFNDNDIKDIIKELIQRGLPKTFGENLIKNLPSGFVPHHNFNVMYVGVGMTTGSVETNLQNMDNCRVSCGEVVEVLQNKLIVKANSLKRENDKFILAEEENKSVRFLPNMLPKIKKQDIVALHWNFAALILTEEQSENLKGYTNKILEVINNLNSP